MLTKFSTLVIVLFGLASTAGAQSDRVVLFEEFTSST